MKHIVSIDLGYNAIKIYYNNEFYIIPNVINFATDVGINFGENAVFEFEGEKYSVGEALSDEAFTTTDYNFLLKFSPLMIFYILKKLDIPLTDEIIIKTGLALVDWGDEKRRKEFSDRISTLNVNGETVNCQVQLVGPQGDGCYKTYIVENNLMETIPERVSVIDIGYRTINFLHYINGKPQVQNSKGFPGHGVVNIMKPFTNYLENTYGMNFSEQEAIKIFRDKEFKMGGVVQENIPPIIQDFTNKFVTKLMNSILVSEKKVLMLSDSVLITGGGSYQLKEVTLPPNTVFNQNPQFANVFGYSL